MARSDGIDRTCVRNANLSDGQIRNTQQHNEREKEVYSNPDIVPERTNLNVHFKKPTGDYAAQFAQMEADKIISTRGLKPDAIHFGELVFDVNSAWFYNHGGYEFAKQYYEEAYRAAVEIVGGEEYILSAVMHADERNRAMSEALGEEVYHYHLHVVYVPVVEKQILWSKRCKDEALRGTVRETIMQVSHSKKWQSKPALDENGDPLLTKQGKPVLKKSYSILQDDYYDHMKAAGYEDLARGERGSTEEHLTVTQFKVEKEKERLEDLEAQTVRQEKKLEQTKAKAQAQEQKLNDMAPLFQSMEQVAERYSQNPEKVLPPAGTLESGKSYRENKAAPLVDKLQSIMRSFYHGYLEVKEKLRKALAELDQARDTIAKLKQEREELQREKQHLLIQAEKFNILLRGYGPEKVDEDLQRFRKEDEAFRERMMQQKAKQSQQRPIYQGQVHSVRNRQKNDYAR